MFPAGRYQIFSNSLKRRMEGISYFPYTVALSGRDKGPPPHLTRETFSGRRPADGADTLGGVFRPGENLPGGRRYCRHLPAEKERMISGRTFAREMIALRQRKAKRAGRILALQGQNPGQLELRTHSEFGANLSVTPGALPSLCLRAILEEAVQPDIILSSSAPAKTKPQYLLLQPAMPTPGTKDSYTIPPPRPLAVPAASSPA